MRTYPISYGCIDQLIATIEEFKKNGINVIQVTIPEEDKEIVNKARDEHIKKVSEGIHISRTFLEFFAKLQ